MTIHPYKLICCDCGETLRDDCTKFATAPLWEVVCCQKCRDKRMVRVSADITARCATIAKLLNGATAC